jgi:hypothetical protein
VLAGGGLLGVGTGAYLSVLGRRRPAEVVTATTARTERAERRETWRMPPLGLLTRPVLTIQRKVGLMALRGYLIVAFALVVVKVVQEAVR